MNVHARLPNNTLFDDLPSGNSLQYELLNDAAIIGHNHPPSDDDQVLIDLGDAIDALDETPPPDPVDEQRPQSDAIVSARYNYLFVSQFLAETPVIETREHATKAANFLEQARKTIQDMEAERRAQTDPLRAKVEDINSTYRLPRESIEGLLDELKHRLKVFSDAEEERPAEEAERAARAAEEAERAAMADADQGVIVDVAAAIVEADKAFNTFKKADRTAARAARSTKVRLNGGFDRAVSMHSVETLIVEDAIAAITELRQYEGLLDKVNDAILSAAREYRKLHAKLPAGVTAERERKY